MRRPPPLRRRRLLLFGIVALLIAGGTLLAVPWLMRWYVGERVIPLLSKRLQRQVTVGRIRVSFSELVLEDLQVSLPGNAGDGPMARMPRLRVDYKLGPLLRGRLVARRVLVEQPSFRLWRRADGSNNFLDLLSRRRLGGGGGKLRIEELVIGGGRLNLDDGRSRLSLTAGQLEGRLRSGELSRFSLRPVTVARAGLGNRLSLGELQVTLRYAAGRITELPRVRLARGRVRLLPHLELSGIRGTIGPERDRIAIQLEGSYGGAEAKLWSASGWIDPVPRLGVLKVKAVRFSLGRIASILHQTPVILPQRTLVDGTLELSYAEEALHFGGQLEVKDLNLFHPALARTPVLELSGGARLKGRWEIAADKLILSQLDLSARELQVKVQGLVERLSGKPHLSLQLAVPPVPCQNVLRSFPPSLLPQLQGFELRGTFAVDLRSDVDFASLDAVELGGSIGIKQCKVVKAPETMEAARLLEPFDHEVEPTPGQTQAFTVGPENSDFVPYADLPRNMINAVLTTEDAGFFRHRGFIPSQFRNALARNLQKGGFRLGASTISMQLVKNVLLSHEKTLSRKLQELFLTWYLEQHLSKERMMEIYLNVIEFGPGIYGVGAAARHYFGKPAKEITPLEAAFFASLLPSPKRRYVQYCRGELSPQWDRYVRRLLRRMKERGHLDEATLKAAEEESLSFSRDPEALTVEDCQAEVKELVDSWQLEHRRRLREAILRAAPHQVDLHLRPVPETPPD